MRGIQNYFCTARCGNIAIPARRKSAFGGKPGEPWPKETTCPRCGAKAFEGDGPGKELYWEWQSILHGYHDRYLSEHGLENKCPREIVEQREREQEEKEVRIFGRSFLAPLDPSRIYLLARGQARDVTSRFRGVPA